MKTIVSGVVDYIMDLKAEARNSGKKSLTLVARDVHSELGFSNRVPTVCSAMRKCMQTGDVVVHDVPKGNSTTIEIKYFL